MRRYGRRRRQARLLNGLVSVLEGQASIGLTFADLGTKRNVLGGSALDLLLGRHCSRITTRLLVDVMEVDNEE